MVWRQVRTIHIFKYVYFRPFICHLFQYFTALPDKRLHNKTSTISTHGLRLLLYMGHCLDESRVKSLLPSYFTFLLLILMEGEQLMLLQRVYQPPSLPEHTQFRQRNTYVSIHQKNTAGPEGRRGTFGLSFWNSTFCIDSSLE